MAALIFIFLFAATCPEPLPFILAAAIHECAHILCAFFLRMGAPRIRINRAWIRIEYSPCASAARRILLCLSGPAIGIAVGLLLRPFPAFSAFSTCSLSLGILNLLPLSCFDGGCVLREICFACFLPDTAWRITRAVSVISVILLWSASALVQLTVGVNYTMLFLSAVLIVTILTDKA